MFGFPDSQQNKSRTGSLSQCKSLLLGHGTIQKSFVESRHFEGNTFAARSHRCHPWFEYCNLLVCFQLLFAWVVAHTLCLQERRPFVSFRNKCSWEKISVKVWRNLCKRLFFFWIQFIPPLLRDSLDYFFFCRLFFPVARLLWYNNLHLPV